MRVIQTVNDSIRLLFNPKTEVFSLSDFLLVRDNGENFLAQVVEVYDDKFDQEANVAKIRLVYRIVNGNEIVPYNNYTPSRECEVAKIKQSEIEKCINLNKKTIVIGTSAKTKEKTHINTRFFENNCVLFADKFERTNQIFEALAPKLSEIKNVLVLDFSGTCIPENAVTYVAGENFRMSLSSSTIDYIQQKVLLRARLETQVVLGDVFEEVKKFLETTEDNYVPFLRFLKVIQAQCRQTPSVELLVLLSWLKKYARMNIFAKHKREFESVFKSFERNKITTIDLSNIKTEWQKEYFEYIINNIKNDMFVLVRLNDNNINNDILNKIYLKKKNISFIPGFSYNYKKAPYIMDYAQNYILTSTMNPKRDFTHANFQIQALNKKSYVIFGEDTKDFIFVLENNPPVKKTSRDELKEEEKVFISLNLQLQDMTPFELMSKNFEVKTVEPSKKRLQEEIRLSDVLGNDNEETESIEEEPKDEGSYVSYNVEETVEPQDFLGEAELDYFNGSAPEENLSENTEEPPVKEIEKKISSNPLIDGINKTFDVQKNVPAEPEKQDIKNEEKSPDIKTEILAQKSEVKTFNAKKQETPSDEKPDVSAEPVQSSSVKEETEPDKKNSAPPEKEDITADEEAIIRDEFEEETETPAQEIKDETIIDITDVEPIDITEDEINPEDLIDDNILDAIDEVNSTSYEALNSPQKKEEKDNATKEEAEITKPKKRGRPKKNTEKDILIEETKNAVTDIIDEVVSQKTQNDAKNEEQKASNEPPVEETSNEEDEIDKKFEEIMNETDANKKSGNMLKIDDNVSIDLEKIKQEVKNNREDKLPVFNEEPAQSNIPQGGFKEGDKVSHERYGTGQILKVINYGQKSLLQIEFPEIGKRLLDPKIAKLDKAN